MPLLQLGTAHLVTQAGVDPTLPPHFVGMLPERTYRQLELALQQGLRALDTALIYGSHGPIGAVLGEWWRTHPLQTRTDIWITTKVFHPNATQVTFGLSHMPTMEQMTPEQVTVLTREHVETSLLQLGVGYVDLLLLHWPSGLHEGSVAENRQRRIAAWKVLEDLYMNKGWARAIGVSNFSPRHLEQLKEDGALIVPMINQIEASVTLQYTDIVEYCLINGIVPQAYSPFGRGLTELPTRQLQEIADKYGKQNIGQVAIKYLLQLGYAVTYLSNSADRILSNTDVFDFELNEQEMQLLKRLHRPDGGWGLPKPHDLY